MLRGRIQSHEEWLGERRIGPVPSKTALDKYFDRSVYFIFDVAK
jgi:hypothetical protein